MAKTQSTATSVVNQLAKRVPSHGALTKYDPQKGLKGIAVAEAAEKHYARAKDATKLQQAIRAKLTAQAEFVFWWDTHGDKDKGGRPSKTRSRSATGSVAGKNGLPERYVIDRWRRRLNDPYTFEATYEQAVARYIKTLEFETIDRQLKASESNEWYTPACYVESARRVLGGIDLDPASNADVNRTVQAASIFSIEDDGLTQEWHGRVWLNPPYGGLSGPFAARLVDQFEAGKTTAAVLLVNSNSTDAAWFQPLWDYLLCFTHHRINFISPVGADSGSTHGSVFVYFGNAPAIFASEFSQWGTVVCRYQAAQ